MAGQRNGRASSPTSPSSSPSRELSSSALRAPAAVLAVCCLLAAIAMSSDDRNAYYYLGADLGGTNFRVALYKTSRAGEDPAAPIFTHHYRNLDHGGVEEMLADFLHQSQSAGFASDGIDAAAISVAGAVANNSCNMTNLDETVDGDALSRRLGIRGGVTLINDFVGAGYGLLTLQPSEYITLQEGEPAEGAPVALVGAGTGLGECFVTRDARGEPTCWPSEGGHAEWAPRTPMELELAQWLMAKYSQQGSARRVSVERLVSGSGLADIYEWLATEKSPERAEPEVLRRVREGRKDERPVTVAQCAGAGPADGENSDELCAQAMDIFLAAYGSEAGVAALKWLPFGGLYIGGGIAPKQRARIEASVAQAAGGGGFMGAFRDKGRMSGLMAKVPVRLVLAEDIGQRGAQFVAVQTLRRWLGAAAAAAPA